MKNILSTMAVTLVLSTNFAFAGDTGNTPGPANVLNIPISSVQLTEEELGATRGKAQDRLTTVFGRHKYCESRNGEDNCPILTSQLNNAYDVEFEAHMNYLSRPWDEGARQNWKDNY